MRRPKNSELRKVLDDLKAVNRDLSSNRSGFEFNDEKHASTGSLPVQPVRLQNQALRTAQKGNDDGAGRKKLHDQI